jgi:hypothetical protein
MRLNDRPVDQREVEMNPLVLELLKKDVGVEVRGLALLTVKQAAEDIGIPVPKLKQRIKLGLITTINLAGKKLIPRGEVLRIKTEGID